MGRVIRIGLGGGKMRDSLSTGLHFFCFVNVLPVWHFEIVTSDFLIDNLTQKEYTLEYKGSGLYLLLKRSFSFSQDHLFPYWMAEPFLQSSLAHCHKVLCPFSHVSGWTWLCSTFCWYSLALCLGSLWSSPYLQEKLQEWKERALTLDNKSFIDSYRV